MKIIFVNYSFFIMQTFLFVFFSIIYHMTPKEINDTDSAAQTNCGRLDAKDRAEPWNQWWRPTSLRHTDPLIELSTRSAATCCSCLLMEMCGFFFLLRINKKIIKKFVTLCFEAIRFKLLFPLSCHHTCCRRSSVTEDVTAQGHYSAPTWRCTCARHAQGCTETAGNCTEAEKGEKRALHRRAFHKVVRCVFRVMSKATGGTRN